MLLLTLLLSLALAAFFTLLPARVLHRRTTRADLYAGAGVAVLVWLWAVCVWSKPGLTVDFDGFRLAALLAMQLLACGVVTGFRLRHMLPTKLLHAHRPAALPDRRRRPRRADRAERRKHNAAIHRPGFPDL